MLYNTYFVIWKHRKYFVYLPYTKNSFILNLLVLRYSFFELHYVFLPVTLL